MSKVLGFIIAAVEITVGIITANPALIITGIATVAGSAVQLLTGRPHQNLQNDQSVKANVRGTTETHNVVFGKARVGGIVFKAGTYKGSASEDSNNNLLIAIAHSICHPGGCDGIERVWIDDREIPLAQLTRTTSGAVQTTQPGSGPNLGNYTAITHLGTSTQTADATLVARGLATATDYARGICYSVFNLYRDKNNQDGFIAAFNGRIPLLTVELRGNRCYDPRLDSTAGGSGSQRVADYTTWTWSDNPAICTATYMIMAVSDGGEGIPAAEIDWAYAAAAANICDQTLTTPAGSQKRYRVSAALSTGDRRNDNRSKLLDAMFGTCVRVGAKYRIYAGAYANPTDSIDETWLAGGPSVVPKTELTQLFNAVRITYTDEKQGYRSLETAPFTNSGFETQDGGDRLFRSISYPTCPDAYQAQLLGAIAGNKSRRQMQVTLTLNWKGLNLDPWQTVSLDIAALPRLAGRTFRVTSWQWTSQGPIVGLSEDNAADYTIAAYTTVDGAVITTSTTFSPPERVTSLSALAVADGVQLSWVDTNTSSLRKQIFRSAAGAGIFGQIGTTTASYFKDAFTTGASYDYKVVVVSDYGVPSPDSAIVNSSGKTVADGADVTARAGLVLLQNPSFENGNSGWELQTGWGIAQDAANSRGGGYVGVFSGTSSAGIVNQQHVPVDAGDQILALCWIKSSAGATGIGSVNVYYYTGINSGYVSNVQGSVVAAGTTYRQSRLVATVPAGVKYARIAATVAGASAGNVWYADDFAGSLMPKSQDDVPDGSLYQRGTTRRGFDLIQNGDFELSSVGVPPGWSFGSTGLLSGEVGGSAPASSGYTTGANAYVGAQSLQVNTNGAYQSVCHRAVFRVTPGEVYSLRAAMKVAGIGSARMVLRYYNASNTWMQGAGGPSDFEVSTTATSWSLVGGNCTIPAGAVSAILMFDCIANTSSGSFFIDAVTFKRISSLDDDVQDGPVYGRVLNTALTGNQPDFTRPGILNRNLDNLSDTANFSRVYTSRVNVGRPFIDFGEGIHTNKNLDNISDTANYSRIFTGRVNAGRPTIDFSEGIHGNKSLDYIADTGSFARVSANHVIGSVPALSVAGSGIRLGDQRNAPAILIANARSKWLGLGITFSYTAASPAIVTIATSAATLQMGNASVSYSAMSAQVSQARSSTVTYFLYCDDTSFAGGGRTLVITTSGDSLYQADGRIYVGSVTISVSASGTGTPTGGGDGGGGACVTAVAFEPSGRQFSDLDLGDRLQIANEQLVDLGEGHIEQIGLSRQVCVTVIAENGAQLTCSLDAPIAIPDGYCYASDLFIGQPIATLVDGAAAWSPVEAVEPRGVLPVRPLFVGNRSFWAGDTARACILHHNAKVIP